MTMPVSDPAHVDCGRAMCLGLGQLCQCRQVPVEPRKTELEVEVEALKIATEALLSCPYDSMKERIVKYLIDRFNVQTP